MRILKYIFLLITAFLFLFPIAMIVSNSFMSGFEVVNNYTKDINPNNVFFSNGNIHYVRMNIIPEAITIKQYLNAFIFENDYIGYFINSIKITVPIVIGNIFISAPAAFYLNFTSFKYKDIIFFIYLIILLTPLQVTMVPNYFLFDMLKIKDSHLPIILPAIFNPFGVFLMNQFFAQIPKEYFEAAEVDGASVYKIFFYVASPLTKPIIAALAILTFIEYWNLIDQAVVFIPKESMLPLSIYIANIINENMSVIFAVSVFYMFPALLLFLLGKDYIVSGIQLSGIK